MFSPLPEKLWTRYSAAHLLNRAGFGGTPREIGILESKGMNAAVDSLLKADDDGDLFSVPPLMRPEQRFAFQRRIQAAMTEEAKMAIRKELRFDERTPIVDLRVWWLNRMRYTSAPLIEKTTLFWHGHFATSNQKVNDAYLMWQQNETLRHFALGKFPELLKAMSRDPAMIRWLDLGSSRKGHPNENFAREVMELFSLGEGHYSEKDVQEAARAFTGYRLNPESEEFVLLLRDEDISPKTFLGKTGAFNGDAIIDMIVAQPECARFIGRKLWTFFVAEKPSDEIVQGVANLLLGNGYDIGATLGVIFRSADFYFADFIDHQIKSPVQWLVQTTKMLEIPLPDDRVIENALSSLGQVLFAPPNVKGWDGGRAWISASTLLFRYNLASYLLSGKAHVSGSGGTKTAVIPLDKIVPVNERKEPHLLLDHLGFRVFNAPLPQRAQGEFLAFLEKHPIPYTDNIVRDLLQIMMSTPEYQLC